MVFYKPIYTKGKKKSKGQRETSIQMTPGAEIPVPIVDLECCWAGLLELESLVFYSLSSCFVLVAGKGIISFAQHLLWSLKLLDVCFPLFENQQFECRFSISLRQNLQWSQNTPVSFDFSFQLNDLALLN